MSFGFDSDFAQPFFGGGSSVSVAANRAYPVSLNGIPYELDTRDTKPRHASIPELRPAQDIITNVGRQTLNPEAFWRRAFESWHVGAGQTLFDRADESNPFRFRRSRGADIWTKYQLGMLKDTDEKLPSANSNLYLATTSTHLYIVDGTALKYTTDVTVDTPSFTTVTGGSAVAFTSMASDGFNVLLAAGSSGINKTTRGAATKTAHITGTVAEVYYGKGRWLASQGAILYDISTLVAGGGALPAAFFTQINTDFVWNCSAEGPTALYMGGFSGDKSLIYRLSMKEDGTGLNQPVVAGFLPDGEIIKSMQGYLGFVLIGTSRGVRVGVVGGNGDLTIGSFIPTDTSVLCFEGQDKFVWFGWTNFEAGRSGLGRLGMETFSNIDNLAPAYASDLMVTSSAQGAVQAVVTFQGIRVFTVAAAGMWAEHQTRLVATAELDTGAFDYGLIDSKLSLFLDSSHSGVHTTGTHSFSLAVDGGTFTSIGTVGDEHQSLGTGEAVGTDFEVRASLARDTGAGTTGPTLRSFGLRAEPVTPLVEVIEAPLLIGPVIHRLDKTTEAINTLDQVDNIRDLRASKNVVLYSEAGRGWSVIVMDYVLDEHDIYVGSDEQMGINGTCLVRLKVVV